METLRHLGILITLNLSWSSGHHIKGLLLKQAGIAMLTIYKIWVSLKTHNN